MEIKGSGGGTAKAALCFGEMPDMGETAFFRQKKEQGCVSPVLLKLTADACYARGLLSLEGNSSENTISVRKASGMLMIPG